MSARIRTNRSATFVAEEQLEHLSNTATVGQIEPESSDIQGETLADAHELEKL
jgi:hypothetical protein